MSESEEVYQKRDIILARLDVNMQHMLEMVTHHRKEVKDHIENDRLDFKALGIELTNLEDKNEARHNKTMQILLPALGGFSVIMFLINWLIQ